MVSIIYKSHYSFLKKSLHFDMRVVIFLLIGFCWAEATNCRCGWTKSGQSRIVGGNAAQPNEFPMMVGIKGPKDFGPFCGGVIITKRHILTAAHCIHDHEFRPMVVLVGAHNISNKGDPNVQEIKVKTMIPHADFNKEGKDEKDIAILYLEKDITFSEKVGPVCMPTEKTDLIRKMVRVMGWGLTRTGGQHSEILKVVDLEVRPLSFCEPAFPGMIPLKRGQTCHYCTFSPDKDACQGDSGGPLLWKDPEIQAMTVVGVISFGGDCGESPGINTEVFHYIDWIQEQITKTDKSQSTCHK